MLAECCSVVSLYHTGTVLARDPQDLLLSTFLMLLSACRIAASTCREFDPFLQPIVMLRSGLTVISKYDTFFKK